MRYDIGSASNAISAQIFNTLPPKLKTELWGLADELKLNIKWKIWQQK